MRTPAQKADKSAAGSAVAGSWPGARSEHRRAGGGACSAGVGAYLGSLTGAMDGLGKDDNRRARAPAGWRHPVGAYDAAQRARDCILRARRGGH
jgi:hypothetical protein